jgi:hypothetical protein
MPLTADGTRLVLWETAPTGDLMMLALDTERPSTSSASAARTLSGVGRQQAQGAVSPSNHEVGR